MARSGHPALRSFRLAASRLLAPACADVVNPVGGHPRPLVNGQV